MLVYRLSQKKYNQDLKGEGAYLFGGRWNPPEHYMLYTAAHISLSVLEILVHVKLSKFDVPYSLITIQLPEIKHTRIDRTRLKKGWDTEMEYTQQIGQDFLQNMEFLFMEIPSAVIPQEKNILINPMHKEARKIKIIKTEDFKFDKRLLLK